MSSRLACPAVLLAALLVAHVALAAPTFVGAEKCKPCHMPEYETWMKEPHAGATITAKAADDYVPACLKCHATAASEALPGVQCEACHGPGSEYWPIPVMFDKAKAVEKGLVMPGDAMCSGCHDGQEHHTRVQFGDFHHRHREKHEAQELD